MSDSSAAVRKQPIALTGSEQIILRLQDGFTTVVDLDHVVDFIIQSIETPTADRLRREFISRVLSDK